MLNKQIKLTEVSQSATYKYYNPDRKDSNVIRIFYYFFKSKTVSCSLDKY